MHLAGSKVTSEGATRLQSLLPKTAVVHIAIALEADKKAEQWVKSQGGDATLGFGRLVRGGGDFIEGNIPAGGIENLGGLRGISWLSWARLGNLDRDAESIARLDSLQSLTLFGKSIQLFRCRAKESSPR